MPVRTKIVALVISVGMLLLVVELVRRRKLREEYSQLWIITACIIVLMMVWFDLLRVISHLLGAVNQISTIFFLAFLFLIGISLHFSVVISKLTNRVKDLAQQNALLEGELEKLKKKLP